MGGRTAVPADPAAAPMLSLEASAMDRLNHELSVQRDRFVRLQSVQNDLALDLPTSIPLPDGEEIPYGSSTRLQIRDPQQEAEIYQKCIRPPPNKTVFDGDSPPSYRASTGFPSNSRGRFQPQKKSSDLFGRTVRCFGGKSKEEPAPPPMPPPCVHVPAVLVPCNRSRKLAAFSENATTTDIASVPAVSCAVPANYSSGHQSRQASTESHSGDKLRSHSSGIASGGTSGTATGGTSGIATGGASSVATGGGSNMAAGGAAGTGTGYPLTLQTGWAPSFATPSTLSGFTIGYPPAFLHGGAAAFAANYTPGLATRIAAGMVPAGPSGSGSSDNRAAKGNEKKSEKMSV